MSQNVTKVKQALWFRCSVLDLTVVFLPGTPANTTSTDTLLGCASDRMHCSYAVCRECELTHAGFYGYGLRARNWANQLRNDVFFCFVPSQSKSIKIVFQGPKPKLSTLMDSTLLATRLCSPATDATDMPQRSQCLRQVQAPTLPQYHLV